MGGTPGTGGRADPNGTSVLNDPARLAALERSRLLDTPPEEAFDRLTRMASRLLEAPVALVSLVDDQRQFFKSAVGLSGDIAESRATPLSHSYCQHVVRTGATLVVDDARQHPLLHDNPAIADANAISYCGVPIVDPAGRTLGSFCVLDHKARSWTQEEIDDLQDLAASVTAEVRLRFLANDLEEANNALRSVIATASHDVRNALAVVKGFAGLLAAEDDISDNERKEFANEIRTSADEAHQLVTELIRFGRLQAGAVEPQTTVTARG